MIAIIQSWSSVLMPFYRLRHTVLTASPVTLVSALSEGKQVYIVCRRVARMLQVGLLAIRVSMILLSGPQPRRHTDYQGTKWSTSTTWKNARGLLFCVFHLYGGDSGPRSHKRVKSRSIRVYASKSFEGYWLKNVHINFTINITIMKLLD